MMHLLLLGLVWAACTPVRGPLLRGVDLAAADPQFSSVPADASIGYSPAPGARRNFSEAEIVRLSSKFGLTVVPHELCFTYAMEDLDRTTVLAVMEQALPGSEIEILEFPHTQIPQGRLVFAITALPKAPSVDGTVIWRGFVEYGERLKFPIWAKVKISVASARVVAVKPIAAGQVIGSGDVEERIVKAFPGSERWLEAKDQLIGRRALRSLQIGESLSASSVQAATLAIARGDTVTVAVESGAAHLTFDTRAESDAAIGGSVKLRNPKSGKTFEARVTGKGVAILDALEGKGEKP